MKRNRDALSKERQDAKELIGILDKIPDERKGEVLGIVKGFALCAENDAMSPVKSEEESQHSNK